LSSSYMPLDARGWRLSMGLRPLDLAAWLEVDEHYDEELALKTRLLEDQRDVVVATESAGNDASLELLIEIRENLRAHHPGISVAIRNDEHPIVAASRYVQEDLCVLVRDDAWRLRAACVCFPSRWNLATKIGTTLDEIHQPVPGYHEELARPTNSFFDRLKPDRSFWRLNWTLLDSPALYQPDVVRRSPSGRLDDWYFRVERQTLRALPRTKAVVFTIRTYVTSAAMLRERDDTFVSTLLHALDTAPASVQSYKGWTGVAERLRVALDQD
jgi:dimethylamine monooxygenase subunit A